ncbi:MAG: Pectate lyase superfamily protein [Lentisphaerae bacterium ADurb.BinA184]|nr:MAG: Pectate lyase superfamily protein [Lentisphaerae bacterium ADurb.BinA184]
MATTAIPDGKTASAPTGDGVTDNSPIFEEAFARLAAAGVAGLRLPAGIYRVSRTLELPTGVSLLLDPGARIVAMPRFAGEAMIRKQRCQTHAWGGRISGGMIDGGKQDLIGIHVPGACRMDIADIEIVDCLRKGIYIGLPVGEKTWGYEVSVRGVRCAIDMQTRHAPGSVGLHYEQVTDSYVSQVVIIGYETGVAAESSSNDFSQVHVWSVPAHGPLKRNFYCNGWGDSYSQCYADAPFDEGRECYGFVVNRPFNRFTGCRVYSNNYTFDNTVVGFHITASGTHGSYLGNLFTAGTERRIKAAYAGSLEAATILGNGYDPNILAGRENRIPSDTGGISHVPRLTVGDDRPDPKHE